MDSPVTFGEGLSVGLEYEAERKAQWNRENVELKREHDRTRTKAVRPFAGFDGEGWDDENRRHSLYILRAGENELYTGNALDLYEMLEWLVSLPRNVYYVGFSLGYDWGMMLKDLPRERFLKLYDRESRTRGRMVLPVDWGPFRLEWIPGKRFTVSLADDKSKRFSVEDCFGCFQQSFAVAIEHWRIPTKAEAEFIEAMKSERRNFRELAATAEGIQSLRDYNALECRLLARMMERVRDACNAQRIRPTSWFGAGQLAQALLRKNRAKETFGEFSPPFMEKAESAYYGGFFDVSEVGMFPGMYEYDIGSAYPHIMRELPCLAHAELRHGNVGQGRTLYRVRWEPEVGASPTWGAFPVRHSRGERMLDGTEADFVDMLGKPSFTPGTLYYPERGEGWYWDSEVMAVIRRGEFRVELLDAWELYPHCDCKPFHWVPELFDYRKKLGKSGQGMVLKLGMNSLYGKLAQRVGRPQFANVCYAGMVTAGTRSMIHGAIQAAGPDNVVMVATDAVYAKRPIEGLAEGSGLGEWEGREFGDYIVILPGLHYAGDATRLKTRSIPLRVIRDALDRIRNHWYSEDRWSPIEFALEGFISNQLAYRLGRPEVRGEWRNVGRSIRFGSPDKRRIPYEDTESPSVRLPLWENLYRLPSGHRSEWDYAEAVRVQRERERGIPDYESLSGDQPDFLDPLAIWDPSG